MLKWMAREKGLLTVFFAGFLSLLLITVGILGDYLRIQVVGAEMRTGLRLSSKMGLAQFDKKLAREYGLFAVRDLSEVDRLAKEGWDKRFAPSSIRSDSFIVDDQEIRVEGIKGMTLSAPKNLEDQIDQFMDWQTPRILWSEVQAHFNIYQRISQLSPVMEAKIAFEKGLKNYHDQLVQVGKLLDRIPSLPEAWTVVHGGCEIFKGIPPLKENLLSLESGLEDLETSLDRAIKPGQGDGEVTIEGDDLDRIRDQFEDLKKSYQDTKIGLMSLVSYLTQINQAMKRISGQSVEMKEKAGSWEAAVKELPPGAMASGFRGDFQAKTGQENFEDFDRLASEMEKMGKVVADQLEAWKEVSFEGKKMDQLSFSTWLDREKSLIRSGQRGEIQAPGKNSLGGKEFSEEVLDAQSSLTSLSPDKRAGLLEFIQAWNQKRKLKKQAKWADKLRMTNLAGSLPQYIPSDSLSRYPVGGGLLSGSENLSIGGLTGDTTIMDLVLSGFKQSSQAFAFEDFLDETGIRAKLYLYWTGMFSHRTTQKMEEKEGEDRLSLTGYPLKDRPFYGGELEYILFGKDAFLDNLQRAALAISGLRLMMNAAYAFTSADLHQQTAPLATAIAGWSGFGVPFVQSVFLGILAIGETKLDMDDLLAGMEVPVLKSPSSWRFSLSGIKPMAQSMVGDLFDVGEFQAVSSVEAANELVNEKMTAIASSAKEMAKNAIKTPIQTWMTQAFSKIQKPDPDKEAGELKALIGQIGSVNSGGSLDRAIQGAGHRLGGKTGELMAALGDLREEKAKEKRLTADLMKTLNDKVDGIVDPLVDQVTTSVDEISDQWTRKLHGICQKSEAESKKALGQWLDGFQKEMGGGDLGTGLATGAGLSMGYEDYIKLFIFMALTGPGKEALLVNTCKLIHAENGDTDLTLAPTALSWTGLGRVRLTLIGKNRIWAPSSTLEEGAYEIKKTWIEGYGEKEIEDRGGGG